tara:strand:+ start:536 stop:949 length:414 start_codon:yes stop_codon:yes gene_type:complete
MTQLAMDPDYYSPNTDIDGKYIDGDVRPWPDEGIRCPCGTRKDIIFTSRQKLNSHKKTQGHQRWLFELNNNKQNLYIENIKLKETIKTQKEILTKQGNKIAQLDKDINDNNITIVYLTKKIQKYEETKDDLHDINFN